MDKLKLRKCAKLSSCESCSEYRYCNYKEVIQQMIIDNFIHIDLKEWRNHRRKGGNHEHRKNDRSSIKKTIN